MICFRLLDSKDPAQPLADAVRALVNETVNKDTYKVEPISFQQVPNAPFAYWVSEKIRKLFATLPPFESEDRTAKQGLATADDFRFVRTAWETPINQKELTNRTWFHFAKGGSYSPYYADINCKVNWPYSGSELDAFKGSVLRNTEYYFRSGLTWPLRGIKFSAQAVPRNCIFSVAGKIAMAPTFDENRVLLAIFNSPVFDYLIRIFAGKVGGVQYEVGLISSIPTPTFQDYGEKLKISCTSASTARKRSDTANLNSHAFVAPAFAPSRARSNPDIK